MDNLLYIAMSGAKENMNALAVRSNNLANASTIGFKADFENARAMQAYGEGLPTRVFSMAEEPGQNMSSGAIETTGRELDVAVKGDGWIAVEDSDGNEAYTRMGSLVLDQDGTLRTSDGRAVLDDSGEHIELPALSKIEINQDGTVGGRPDGEGSEVFEEYQRIKLVNPEKTAMYRGTDGLFRMKSGATAEESDSVRLINGALESSNVNVVDEMTSLIRIQRQYDMQVKLMSTAKEMDESQNQRLRPGA